MFFLENPYVKESKKYTVVISWWWTRWFYALWVLKWIEELKMEQNIKALYGVSAWSLVGSFWAAWMKADRVFDKFIDFKLVGLNRVNFLLGEGILKWNYLREFIQKDLPKTFEELKIPFFVGATDLKKANFILFSKWELVPAVVGSTSIPGVFPPVEFGDYILADGWVMNNFPVAKAKEQFPENEIIWINLNKFQENQNIKNVLDVLNVSFEIMLRAGIDAGLNLVDHLFYRSLGISVLSSDKKGMKKIYELGRRDCVNYFSK